MITLLVFISIFIVYVAFLFIRGTYHEKKDKKQNHPINYEDTK